MLSIVIPVYNEEGNVRPLLDTLSRVPLPFPYEILIVDDGSTDGTLSEIQALLKTEKHLRLLALKRNFGQTAALAAGVDHAKGQIIITMDGDGQNDPRDIPALLQKLDEGYDVVSGWRKNRHDSWLVRTLPSRMANGLISFTTGVKLHDYGCTLKAYKASIIKNVQMAGEMHRFLPAWCAWNGGKVAELPVSHHPRTRGKSKYGLVRTFKVVIDLFTVKFFGGAILKPNYLFSGTGMVFSVLAMLSFFVAVYDKFGPDKYAHFRIPLLLLAVFLGLSALFLFLMGLLSEILVRLYFSVRQQKPYRLADE